MELNLNEIWIGRTDELVEPDPQSVRSRLEIDVKSGQINKNKSKKFTQKICRKFVL
jgi:hypothetical protein